MKLDISSSEMSAAVESIRQGGELGRSYCVMIYLCLRLAGDTDHEGMLGSMLKVLPQPDKERVTQALQRIIGDDFAPQAN